MEIDGTDYKETPNFSAEESKFQDSGGHIEQADLDDIYEQLKDIKGQMTKGVNLFDVTMPFGKMVTLIIKFTFASIPAALIMGFISSVFWLLFGNFLFRAMIRSYGMH